MTKKKERLRDLERRVVALEQAAWLPTRPDPVSEPVDAQGLLRDVAGEYGQCYSMWDEDEWGFGAYL